MQPTVHAEPPATGNGDDPVAGERRMREATQLLRDFLEVSEQFERSLGAQLKVNPTDLKAMEHLLASGPLGPSELARRVGISTASATTAIDRLVAVGHVTREPHPRDRRGVLVVPAESSRDQAMATLMPMIIGIDKELDSFSDGEQEAITRYLRRIVAIYRQHAAPAGPA